MKYIVGLDGGGTKTKCVFADESGKAILNLAGEPSNFLSIGKEKTASNISSLIESGLTKLNSSFQEISMMVAGISGAGRKFHADSLRESLLKKFPENFTNIHVESDARVALEGALAGKAGAILIAGTGSVIFAKDSKENIFRAGGFGRLIGDEGSGYSIGINTLNLISKMIDGRTTEGKLLKKFQVIFHIENSDDLISLVYNPGFDVASIAMFTIKSADEGINEAKNLLDEEAIELVKLVSVISNKVNLSPLRLSLIGSLIENKNYYSLVLKEKIKRLKNVELTAREYSPEMGAVILGQKILSGKQSANI